MGLSGNIKFVSRRPIENSQKSLRIDFIKAHAYGNDFLFIDESAVEDDETFDFSQVVWAGTGKF